jgi:hypothetical protein
MSQAIRPPAEEGALVLSLREEAKQAGRSLGAKNQSREDKQRAGKLGGKAKAAKAAAAQLAELEAEAPEV